MSPRELDTAGRLFSALSEARLGYWGPDSIIKCFLDLGTVFIGGLLGGNVRVDWDTLEEVVQADDLGVTSSPRPGRADIFLNAKRIMPDPPKLYLLQ